MELNLGNLVITVSLSPDDVATLQREGTPLPAFWHGHTYPAQVGDVLVIGQHRCVVQAREWRHDGVRPQLSLLVGPLVRLHDSTPTH